MIWERNGDLEMVLSWQVKISSRRLQNHDWELRDKSTWTEKKRGWADMREIPMRGITMLWAMRQKMIQWRETENRELEELINKITLVLQKPGKILKKEQTGINFLGYIILRVSLGQCDYFICYYTGEYMSLYIYQNSYSTQHKECTLR